MARIALSLNVLDAGSASSARDATFKAIGGGADPVGSAATAKADATTAQTQATRLTGAPPAAPTTGTAVSGSLAGITAIVRVTYTNASGQESWPSAASTQVVAANSVLTVTSPGAETGMTNYNVYVTSGADGTQTKQNSTPIALGTGWQEPNTGLITGTDPTLSSINTVVTDLANVPSTALDVVVSYNTANVTGLNVLRRALDALFALAQGRGEIT